MGQLMGKLAEPLQHCSGSVVNVLAGRRKRKRSMESGPLNDELGNGDPQSPKKKKLLTTTQYIYQALFKEQKSSDIAVMAMGKVWNLHKVYLCQSPYFYSMFNGSWKESCQDFVHIKILDERITLEALDAVFGSMYSDEIEIDPKAVISVLATATLFHLDGIIDKCTETMIETINLETAVQYYEAACQYGCIDVKKATFKWLETNLLSIFLKSRNHLRQISIELMTALISSPDLYVMQTEFSLYTLLRTWMYLLLYPDYDVDKNHYPHQSHQSHQSNQSNQSHQSNQGQQQQASQNDGNDGVSTSGGGPACAIDTYFAERADDGQQSFLTTPEGKQFVKPFQALRTQYLTNHHMDLKIVLSDNIIPKEWLHSHVLSHWHSILKVDHMQEEGPKNLDPEEFYKNCMRCGRILLEPGYHKWRWTGFNFGLDLILIADSRVLSIRRHHRNEHERLLSLQTKRQFMIRASVTSINAQRQPVYTQKSDITSLCLEKNEEVTLMLMDNQLVHPLLISVNLLVVPPSSQKFKEHILSNDETNAIPISEIGANCDRSSTPTPTPTPSAADDSAVCVVPPSPPNAAPAAPAAAAIITSAQRPSSARSTVSSGSSSIGSTGSSSASVAFNEFFMD